MKNSPFPFLLILIIFVLFNYNDVSAKGTPPRIPVDSVETVDFPEEFPEDFDFQSEFFAYVSSGWFPIPYPKQGYLFGVNAFSIIDEVRNMRSAGFVPTTNPLQGNVMFRDRYRAFPEDFFRTVDPFSQELTVDEFPPSPYTNEYSVDYIVQGYLPMFLQLRTGIRGSLSLLTSLDTSRSYLTLAGNKKNFTEITTIDIFERRFFFTPKIVIPVYGLYAITEDQTISSIYYVFGSFDMEYALTIDVHQYAQLADVKQELRYEDGTDVQTIDRKVQLSTLNRSRVTIQTGVGFDFSIEDFRLQLEAFTGYPTRSILNDASWRQFPWGFRFNLGFEY